jgi:hypothetical protein
MRKICSDNRDHFNLTNPTVASELNAVLAASNTLGLATIKSDFRRAEDIEPAKLSPFQPVSFSTESTHKRHWPCAATMVLMPFSAPTKVLA